jgi:hypothetical protein
MTKRIRTPQEKKALSYTRDCRNTYGENNKSSRKAIPAFKVASNREMRHAATGLIKAGVASDELAAGAERRLSEKTFKGLHPIKQKGADEPLGAALARKKERRIASIGAKKKRQYTYEMSKKAGLP